MKIKKFNSVEVFNDVQLEKQAQKQIRFLKAVYPFLEDVNSFNEGCIELRPIKRDANLKDFIRSYNAWHLQEKDVENLIKFLGLINGKGYCLYYSGFAFDYDKEVFRQDGKLYQKGKVNNENALFTCILPMDFDHMSQEEFEKEKQRLIELGIETIDVFTGHGFQSVILLSHRVYDKDIFKKFTSLLLAKGFKVDEAIQDPARMLRMLYSFNCKAMDKSSEYYHPVLPEILPTTDFAWTEKRYHVVDVFKKIQSLPDVIPQINPLTEMDVEAVPTAPITTGEIKAVRKAEKEKKEIEIKEVKQIHIQNMKSIYNMLNLEEIPEGIQKMLAGTQAGLRNDTMLFLIPFLRNHLGLSLQTIKKIMTLWGGQCSPKLDASFIHEEVDRIYAYGFKGKHGKLTTKLRKAYGYIDFGKSNRNDKIRIPKTFFQEFDVLSDGAIRIYLALKMAEQVDGIKEFTKKDIQHYADIVERTVERNVKDLVVMGFVCKRRSNRRKGEGYIYYINPYFSSIDGFIMIGKLLVKTMLEQLTDGEMKLYSYLCWITRDGKTDAWAGQKYLAKMIGKKQNSISEMTDRLHEKGFIQKTTKEKDGVSHSEYTIQYT